MTTTGKILVLLNMVMSVFFMGFAMIVYTTRAELREQKEQLEVTIAQSNRDLGSAKTENTQLTDDKKKLTEEIAKKEAEFQRELGNLQASTESLRKELDTFKNRTSRDEAVAGKAADNQNIRDKEIDQLRGFYNEVIAQKEQLLKENSQLKDQLMQSSNDLKLTLARNEEMVERVGELERYINVVTTNYDVPSPETIETAVDQETPAPPPNIEGVVTKVDDKGEFFEISLGEDDGVKQGQTLLVWRTKPEPKYLGRVKVFTTEATKAVVTPVSISGLIQPNDRIGPSIAPYRAASTN